VQVRAEQAAAILQRRVWSCFATVGDHLPEELAAEETSLASRPTCRVTGYWCPPKRMAILQCCKRLRLRMPSSRHYLADSTTRQRRADDKLATLIPERMVGAVGGQGGAAVRGATASARVDYGAMRGSGTGHP